MITKLAREGSNLISRDTSLERAALSSMSTTPELQRRTKVIFSVLMGGTTGTSNLGQVILFQRREFGTLPGTSRLTTAAVSNGGLLIIRRPSRQQHRAPGHQRADSIINVNGGFLYVTEVSRGTT